MAIDLMRVNAFPKPLSAFSTGDAKVDAAIAKLQAWQHPPAHPGATPGGTDYDATVKVANKAPPAALLALLDDAACDTGHTHWDDAARGKLGTKDKRAFDAHYETVALAEKSRVAYLTWLFRALIHTPAGLARVIEIAASPKRKALARVAAGDVLYYCEDPKARVAVAEALDPHRWDGKDGTGQHCWLWRVYRTGAYVFATLDPAKGFDRLHDLCAPAAVKGAAGKARARAVLSGLGHCKKIDARWNAVLAQLFKTDLDIDALMALQNAPPDPAVVEPLCAYFGKSPEKITYFNENAIRLLARSANARAVPYLAAALRASWMHYAAAFEGFREAGDPAMAPVIRAWLKDNGDGPKGERTKLGEAVARELEAKAKKAGAAIAPYAPPPEKKEPAPKRPVLKFKACKPMKLPKLEPLATLEAYFQKQFAAAKLSAHYAKLAQRAVWLIPTRADESKLALGVTKLGGHPDLDAKTEWPRHAGQPLTFLAQIRLEEMAPHLPKGLCPAKGLLSFFVGNDPSDERAGYLENARVLFLPSKAKLARREVPEDFTDLIYQACAVRPMATIKLPSPSNKHVTKLLKKKADWQRYQDEVFAGTPALPQFLGYRDHGWDAEEPATAQMLLQLTGDDQSDMQFGDVEYLSFFMDEAKLRAGDFSRVWPHIGD